MADGTDGARPPEGPLGPLLVYPLDYAFKAIGLAAGDLEAHVVALVTAAVPGIVVLGASGRASSAGKYLSVTVDVRLRSEDERLAVYRSLRGDPRIVHCL